MKKQEAILQKKIDGWIEKNQSHNERQFQIIMDDMERMEDYIKISNQFKFKIDAGKLNLGFKDGANFKEFRVIDHAITQLAERNNIPVRYLKGLINGGDWENGLAIRILSDHNKYKERDRMLIRSVGDDIRGILSDQYRRLDSFQIYSSFISKATDLGAILTDSCAGITRGFVEMVIPKIERVELPNNGEVFMVFGSQLRNSDFGHGALEMRAFKLQVVCMNGATGTSIMREIHLGKRLSENIRLSQRTYELDSQLTESKMNDALANFLTPEGIEDQKEAMIKSSEKIIKPKEVIGALPKMGLFKEEIEGVESYMMSDSSDDGVQGKPSLWKFAQAIGAIGRNLADERKRELYDIAGNVLRGDI